MKCLFLNINAVQKLVRGRVELDWYKQTVVSLSAKHVCRATVVVQQFPLQLISWVLLQILGSSEHGCPVLG